MQLAIHLTTMYNIAGKESTVNARIDATAIIYRDNIRMNWSDEKFCYATIIKYLHRDICIDIVYSCIDRGNLHIELLQHSF